MLLLCLAFLPPVRADEPKTLIEKAIRAHGGEAALAKVEITRTRSTGTFDLNEVKTAVTIDSLTQLPHRFKTTHTFDVMGQRETAGLVFDGEKAWMPRRAGALSAAQLYEVRQTLHARRVESLLPLLRDKEFTLAGLPEVLIGDRPALGVKVSAKGMRECELYFDKENGLLVRSARKTLDLQQKEVETATTYSAWKEFDGLKLPTKLVMHQAGKKIFEGEVLEYKFLDKVDLAEFTQP
jgi:hypothetical protein